MRRLPFSGCLRFFMPCPVLYTIAVCRDYETEKEDAETESRLSGRIEGERLVSCILRWEPVFRGEREKMISDRQDETSRKKRKKVFQVKHVNLRKTVMLSMLVAIGVVISPILRVEGMCPMAHLINIVCSVLLGPWYSLLCAVLIGVIRMAVMGIPPLALTGAVFGALLSGVFYRLSKGKILFAVLGEVIGTGLIGAVVSYPVMTFLWGREGLSWLFYVPSFIMGTLIGGSIAYVLLRKLSENGMLAAMQSRLGSPVYTESSGILSNAVTIAAFGAVAFVAVEVLINVFRFTAPVWKYIAYGAPAFFAAAAVVYFVIRQAGRKKVADR